MYLKAKNARKETDMSKEMNLEYTNMMYAQFIKRAVEATADAISRGMESGTVTITELYGDGIFTVVTHVYDCTIVTVHSRYHEDSDTAEEFDYLRFTAEEPGNERDYSWVAENDEDGDEDEDDEFEVTVDFGGISIELDDIDGDDIEADDATTEGEETEDEDNATVSLPEPESTGISVSASDLRALGITDAVSLIPHPQEVDDNYDRLNVRWTEGETNFAILMRASMMDIDAIGERLSRSRISVRDRLLREVGTTEPMACKAYLNSLIDEVRE